MVSSSFRSFFKLYFLYWNETFTSIKYLQGLPDGKVFLS